MIKQTHLVDSLMSLGIDISKVFSPEHGFRGTADAGDKIENGIDVKTNKIKQGRQYFAIHDVLSLYVERLCKKGTLLNDYSGELL